MQNHQNNQITPKKAQLWSAQPWRCRGSRAGWAVLCPEWQCQQVTASMWSWHGEEVGKLGSFICKPSPAPHTWRKVSGIAAAMPPVGHLDSPGTAMTREFVIQKKPKSKRGSLTGLRAWQCSSMLPSVSNPAHGHL